MGAENTNLVLKVYKTKNDAERDQNALHAHDAFGNDIANDNQPSGYNYFTHEKYYYRIEANEPVKEFYIDWDDGDDNDPKGNANFSLIKLENPSTFAVTEHIYTRDPKFVGTEAGRSVSDNNTVDARGFRPKLRVTGVNGLKSKFYMPSGGRFEGITQLVNQGGLTAQRATDRYIVESDNNATSDVRNSGRIPIFYPTPKPPISVLRADKKLVYAGINNELLVGGDTYQIAIDDLDIASGTGTVTLDTDFGGKWEIYPGNKVILDLSNSDYDETVEVADVTAGNVFTYSTKLRTADGSAAIADVSNLTGTATVTTHRGAFLSLVSNPTVQSARTGVEVEVTYRTTGKKITVGTTANSGDRGDIRTDVLSFGGTTTTSTGVLEVLKVELLDLNEATAADTTTALYPGERIGLKVDDINSEKVFSQYKMIAEVSLGSPIVSTLDKRFNVTYDATESFSRVSDHEIADYYIDTGHDHWMMHARGGTDHIQITNDEQVSDVFADFRSDVLKVVGGVKTTSYSFVPGFEFLDEDNRWLPKQVLARSQVRARPDTSLYPESVYPNANYSNNAKINYSYLTHWRDEGSTFGVRTFSPRTMEPPTVINGEDYADVNSGVNYSAGYYPDRPSDIVSSNLLAFRGNRDPNDWTPLGVGKHATGYNNKLWGGPGSTSGLIMHWADVNTDHRVGGQVNTTSDIPTTLNDIDNMNYLMTCSQDKFTEIYFKLNHGYYIMDTAETATDGSTTDARYFYHSTPEPYQGAAAPSAVSTLTDSGNNGTKKFRHQSNQVSGFYTAALSNTNYEVTISDLDADASGSSNDTSPVIVTVTTSTDHGLRVGDEVFIDCQETITGTASGGDTNTLIDSGVLTQTPDNYWWNAKLKITAGNNVGATFAVVSSDASAASIDVRPELQTSDDTVDHFGENFDSTSVYTLTKDRSECVVVQEVTSDTRFKYTSERFFTDVNPGTGGLVAHDKDNLTGTVRGIATWKPLPYIDKTRYEKHSYDSKDTTFYTSGVFKWEEPEDWIKIDPARIPDRLWPQGQFQGLHTGSDDSFSSDEGTLGINVFDHENRWDEEFPKYGIMWVIDTNNGLATTTVDTVQEERFIDTVVEHCFISSEPHCVTVNVVDPMHVSLNSRAISQSVSYTHKGKYQIIEDRMGMAEIRKIGNSGGTVTFGGVDLKDQDGSTFTRDKFHQYQRRGTPIYLDMDHKSGGSTRFFGVIIEMSEDHPVGLQNAKFGITMQVSHILQIDSSGHKLEDGFISLGGDPLDESSYIR